MTRPAFSALVRHEGRAAVADRALVVCLLVFALLAAYAALSGARWVQARQAEQTIALAQSAERSAGFRKDLALFEADPAAARGKPSWYPGWIKAPTSPDTRAVLPALPLAAMATNAGELQPLIASMRAASSRYTLFDDFGASTQNPASLVVGRFDTVFLLSAVLPLLLLAFSYNLLSAERESGTLALVLSQPVTLVRIVAAKLLVRAALLLVPALVIVLVGLALAGRATGAIPSAAELLALGGFGLLYGGFWLALAALVNARGRSSSYNALALGGLWLLFVLVLPSLLNVASTALYPPPERAELTNTLRATLVASRGRGDDLLSDFNLQHPERPVTDGGAAHDAFDSPKATLKTWLVRERADGLVAPLAGRFNARLAAQQRVAEGLRFLSPSLAFEAALQRLAGVDAARTRAFRAAVQAHLEAFRAALVPKIVAGQPLKAADYERLPRFSMAEPARGSVYAADALGIAAPALLVAVLAARALRRYRIGG